MQQLSLGSSFEMQIFQYEMPNTAFHIWKEVLRIGVCQIDAF